VAHVPLGGQSHPGPRQAFRAWRAGSLWRRAATLIGAAALASLVLPSGQGAAAPGQASAPGQTTPPSLQTLLARARTLSNQINSLDEQANGLRIQLSQARSEAKIEQQTYGEDLTRLTAGKLSIGQLAAESYMTGGTDADLQILTSSNPQNLLSRAAIMQEIQRENGDQVNQLAAAVAAAQRARESSHQEGQRAAQLAAEVAGKQRAAQQKINVLNSAVFAKAMGVFNRTGKWPVYNLPTGDTAGAEALRAAMTRIGDPYVWGGAGPKVFDCSGLVMWAYAQIGISLPHFTGDQWNMGVHVPRADLQPGDLVFFYADISHVGLYLGHGLMVDAPDFGEDVMVQQIDWGIYAGAVQIPG
jgi:peptidoglycan DL-endopeptidase CwlO